MMIAKVKKILFIDGKNNYLMIVYFETANESKLNKYIYIF